MPESKHTIPEGINKHDPHINCPQETHLRTKDSHAESEGIEKNIPCKWT